MEEQQPVHSVMKVLEICRIPPRDSLPQDSLPLTFFDLLWLRNAPSRRLFFYRYASLSLQSFSQTILPRLKRSLSVALNPYPHLAGNITWVVDEKIPTLHYIPGDAVSVTIAEATAVDFRRVSSKEEVCGVDDLFSLLPPLPVSQERAAVMAIQITLFPGNGFCVGYTTHHAVLDGKTTALFMKSWASFCRSGKDKTLPAELTPFYDRGVIFTSLVNFHEAYVAHYMEHEGSNYKNLMRREIIISMPDTVIANFMLTRADLEKIRFSLRHLNRRISNFTAAAAYTWTCSVRAQEKGDSNNVKLVIPVDCRNRSEAPSPIPQTYFGNCIAPLIVSASIKDLTVETAAKAVVEGFDEKNGLLLGGGREGRWLLKLMDGKERVYAVAGSPRFDLYEVDFGWGRPRNVQLVWNRSGIFHFQDAGDGNGGIEISMVMGRTEIQTFSSLFTTCLDSLS